MANKKPGTLIKNLSDPKYDNIELNFSLPAMPKPVGGAGGAPQPQPFQLLKNAPIQTIHVGLKNANDARRNNNVGTPTPTVVAPYQPSPPPAPAKSNKRKRTMRKARKSRKATRR